MLHLIIFTLLFSSIFILPMMNTPLSMGVLILLIAMWTTAFTATSASSWFALILFIIYIGGMLVMFSYFAAIAPNQKMNFSTIIALLMVTFILLSLTMKMFLPNMNTNTLSIAPLMMTFFITPNQATLLLVMALILLLAMIFVVKIAKRNMGPLRPFM